MACLFGHKWNGCKCVRCGKVRDQDHQWNGCTCTVCGKVRGEGHQWQPTKAKCVQVCRICGVKQSSHQLDEKGRCTICKGAFVPWSAFSKDELDLIVKAVGFKRLQATSDKDKERYGALLSSLLSDTAFIRTEDLRELPFGPLMSYQMDLPLGSPERLWVDQVRKKVERIAYKGVN